MDNQNVRRLSVFAVVMFGFYVLSLTTAFLEAIQRGDSITYWGAPLSRVSLVLLYVGLLATAFRLYVDLWVAEDDVHFERSLLSLSHSARAMEFFLRVSVVFLIHLWPEMLTHAGQNPRVEASLLFASVFVVKWNSIVWPARRMAWKLRKLPSGSESHRRQMWHALDWGYLSIGAYHFFVGLFAAGNLKPVDSAMFAGGLPTLYLAAFILAIVSRGSEYRRILFTERTI